MKTISKNYEGTNTLIFTTTSNGELSFKNEGDIKSTSAFQGLFEKTDAFYYDESGRKIVSVKDVESGVCTIDLDGDYNTIYTKRVKDINLKEYHALLNDGSDWEIESFLHARGFSDEVISLAFKFSSLKEILEFDDASYKMCYSVNEVEESDDDNLVIVGGKFYTQNND